MTGSSKHHTKPISDREIFVWPWKMVSVAVYYLLYQPMDEKIKTWTLYFPAKENPKMEKALFAWPIVLKYDVKVKYLFISRNNHTLLLYIHVITSLMSVPAINHADNALITLTLNWVLLNNFQWRSNICVVIVRLIASNSPTSTTRHFIGGISKVK